MNIENQRFEEWRSEQIASLIRMGYPDAAKAFRDLGSVQWAGWRAGWQASRAAIEVELPDPWFYPLAKFNLIAQDLTIKAIEALGLKVKA